MTVTVPGNQLVTLTVPEPPDQAMQQVVDWISEHMKGQHISIRTVADALHRTEDWVVALLQDPPSKDLTLQEVIALEQLFDSPYFER